VNDVKGFIQTDQARDIFNKSLDENLAKLPNLDKPEIVKVYGKDFIEKMKAENKEKAGKLATTNVLNRAFSRVMSGGATNNPHAPENISQIDDKVIRGTLDRIRAIRVGTVHRNYSSRKK
jgi:hypothetical protein